MATFTFLFYFDVRNYLKCFFGFTGGLTDPDLRKEMVSPVLMAAGTKTAQVAAGRRTRLDPNICPNPARKLAILDPETNRAVLKRRWCSSGK